MTLVRDVRIGGLDGIRACAVIAVVWHHAHGGIESIPISLNGFLGVDVFFVLSGYLITTLLLREQATNGGISLSKFYVRRSLRIFPLYFAVLAALTIYFWLKSHSSNQAAEYFLNLPYLLTYTSNLVELYDPMAISWSLSVEEQFYLLWPPLLVVVGWRRCMPILCILIGLNQAVNFGLLDAYLPYSKLPMLQATLTPILLGVMLGIVLAETSTSRWAGLLAGWRLWIIVALLLIVANTAGDIRGWPRLIFQVLTTIALAGVVLHPRHGIVQLLEWKPLVAIGAVSYGIYLLHMIVLYPVERINKALGFAAPSITFLACLVLTFGAAWLSFRYFESPFLHLKNRFSSTSQQTDHPQVMHDLRGGDSLERSKHVNPEGHP